ncbi:MAG: replicative DNA helicase [Clostridiales Family XIII bacterium]|jgi:replicative DNA helicase|nr:replicative DNA helicase [Clostridiales Family XIII bacterium]
MVDRIPPHNKDAEQSVLGAALQSKQALYDVMELLSREDFYEEGHALIFEAIGRLYAADKSVDIVTVSEELSKDKKLGSAGGTAYLGTLVGMVPAPSSAVQYAEIVAEKSVLRKLINQTGEILRDSYEDRQDAYDILDDAERKILEIGRSKQGKDYVSISEAIDKTLKKMEETADKPNGMTGLPTGFAELDRITSGLQDSDLIVLAARPGVGKTSLALNIAAHAAIKAAARVLVFSLEMPEIQLTQRILSAEAKVDLLRIRNGMAYGSGEDMEKVREAMAKLSETKLNIVDGSSGVSINEIKNKCRRLKAKDGLDLVIVDYLQLMDLSGSAKASARPENRQQEIATLSRSLKQLAGEMECPVIVLSQLSRAVETRGFHKPVLSDLRESGAIEQDADIVMFIYENKTDDEDNDMDNRRQLLIAKHRNGETGEIELAWFGRYTKFGNVSYEDIPDKPY